MRAAVRAGKRVQAATISTMLRGGGLELAFTWYFGDAVRCRRIFCRAS